MQRQRTLVPPGMDALSNIANDQSQLALSGLVEHVLESMQAND